jgi:hypothetical protein
MLTLYFPPVQDILRQSNNSLEFAGRIKMTLRITTLSENTAGMGNYIAEWGLSILVESERNSSLIKPVHVLI